MKAILISDHAKWCALMMNGEKTIEVRKGTALYKATQKLIDEYGFAEFYVYCTKGRELLGVCHNGDSKYYADIVYARDGVNNTHNGKVIFKFRCYKVEEIKYKPRELFSSAFYYVGLRNKIDFTFVTGDLLCKESCLTQDELDKYLNKKTGCAIHISDLEIFDKPKELSEFYKYNFKGIRWDLGVGEEWDKYRGVLTKAPQSWCYVESEN